jgi:hypothetical protein
MIWQTPLRVVKAGRGSDPYSPKGGKLTLDPDNGATIQDEEFLVECQPVELAEDTAAGTRVHTRTSWQVITRPGTHIDGLDATDGVLVDDIDGVLEIVGEIGRVNHDRLGHDEFTVTRWEG